MAIVTARVSLTRPIPMRILALSMRLETTYFVAEISPILASLTQLRDDVSDLMKRCTIIGERVEGLQHRVEDLLADIQPLWTDAYNLCGDPECDGDCMVCRDGEYIGEDDYEEKYCRRGRR